MKWVNETDDRLDENGREDEVTVNKDDAEAKSLHFSRYYI